MGHVTLDFPLLVYNIPSCCLYDQFDVAMVLLVGDLVQNSYGYLYGHVQGMSLMDSTVLHASS
jgi:hypothetical protein